ncbi:MAG: MFS transporter [Betaproteobacteria bacterium]
MFTVTAVVFGSTIYAFIILSEHVAVEHAWPAGSSGKLVSAMWLISPLALFAAPIIARFGAWRVMSAGLLIIAASFAATAAVDSFWKIYVLRIVMGAGKTLAVVSMPVIVAELFSRRFGLALAVSWCGGAFGGLALSPLTQLLIANAGWHLTAMCFSVIMLILAVVIAAIGPPYRAATTAATKELGDSTRSSAGSYWSQLASIELTPALVMAVAVATSGIAVLAFAIQMPPFLVARGFSPTAAATVLGLSAAGGMAGNLFAGWLLDRWRSELTSFVIAVTVSLGLIFFAALADYPLVSLASAGSLLFGVGLGSAEILWITLTKRQFGAELFPLTYGGWSFFYALGYALAGPANALANELFPGSEFLIFIAALCALTVVFSVWRPRVRNIEPFDFRLA